MPDLLLTHGYFLYEDPKELQIMKPYAPLGILYLCSHLRSKGFVSMSLTRLFPVAKTYFEHLRSNEPSVLGLYANLMTRKQRYRNLGVARDAGWTTVVGGPEPGAYTVSICRRGQTSLSSAKANSRWKNFSWRCVPGRYRVL